MDNDINKNLKDINSSLSNLHFNKGDGRRGGLSYTKTQKLVTALYMVTDVMDNEEPLRNKLRTLGTEIVSDSIQIRPEVGSYGAGMSMRIDQIVSFLGIASAMNFISEMNCAILKKEFFELKTSMQESTQVKPEWLGEFLIENESIGHVELSNGQQARTRIGVQKGSTLLKALSDKNLVRSFTDRGTKFNVVPHTQNFDMLKKQRRYDIVAIIKNNKGRATIKDIKIKINVGVHEALICSEKTLQRELVSMTKDGVLYKTGEKRWTTYSIRD